MMTAKTTSEILGEQYISNSFTKVGKNPEEFFKLLNALDEVTTFDKVFIKDLILCSPYRNEDDGIVYKAYTDPKPSSKRLPVSRFERFPTIFKELVKEKNCLLWQGGNSPVRICRNKGLRELINALGLSGSAIDNQSPKRDDYVNELIKSNPAKRQVTLVCRTESAEEEGIPNVEKVLSVRTDKYRPIPLSELKEVYDSILSSDMGEVVCKGWYVDHDIAYIDVEFPDATKEFKELCGLDEEIEAGVRLVTSATGYSCFSAIETWRVKSAVSEHATVRAKHVGDWSLDNFIEGVRTNIFDRYSELPERLCSLFDVIIVDDDLLNARGIKGAERAIDCTIKSVFRQLKLSEVFKTKTEDTDRKQYTNRLRALLVDNFSAEMQKAISEGNAVTITAYDIALAIMTLPERAKGVPASYVKSLSDRCGKAAYAEYKPGEEYFADKAAEITLVA